ncbi:MAG: murein biosynthesis integral membrane protein MurJ [Gaiellales bacterium]
MTDDAPRRRLAASTAAFGGATALSRVAGLLRDAIAARYFGSGAAMSAFQVAFNIPNLLRALFADAALSAAFVPVFVEVREKRGEVEAWRVASIVLWLVALILGGLSALFVVLAPLLVPVLMAGQSNVPTDLVVELSRWLFPIVVLLGLTGVVTGILNSYHVFGIPAFAPVVWNLVIIAFLLAFAGNIEAYAIGVLVATFIQFLIPLPLLRGRGSLAFEVTWRNPHVRRILTLMVPVSIGLGLININLTIDLLVGAHASSHTTSDLNYAFRLFMLPQGLFSVAVSAVLFPEISRLAAVRDVTGFSRRIAEGTRTIIFLLLPATAISIVLAAPITRLVYQRGSFGPTQTMHVSAALVAFSLGLVANGLALLLTRSFFALQEPGVPTRVAVVNLFLNFALDLAFLHFGAAGIALSTSIVTAFNAIVLGVILRRRVGSLHMREVSGEVVRIAIASVYCVTAAFAVWWPLDHVLGRSLVAQVISLGLALVLGGVCYVASARMLRLTDADLVMGLIAPARGRD